MQCFEVSGVVKGLITMRLQAVCIEVMYEVGVIIVMIRGLTRGP